MKNCKLILLISVFVVLTSSCKKSANNTDQNQTGNLTCKVIEVEGSEFFNHGGGIVSAENSGYERQPPSVYLDGEVENLSVFIIGSGAGFAGSAKTYQKFYSTLDDIFNDPFKCLPVNLTVFEWCDQCHTGAAQRCLQTHGFGFYLADTAAGRRR